MVLGRTETPGLLSGSSKEEPGETARQALVREFEEELDTEIHVGQLLDTVI